MGEKGGREMGGERKAMWEGEVTGGGEGGGAGREWKGKGRSRGGEAKVWGMD